MSRSRRPTGLAFTSGAMWMGQDDYQANGYIASRPGNISPPYSVNGRSSEMTDPKVRGDGG
jgi:hypothetical protein